MDTVLNSDLREALLDETSDSGRIREILEEVGFYGVKLSHAFLGRCAQVWIERLAGDFAGRPGDLAALKRFTEAVDLLPDLQLEVDLKIPVDLYHRLLHRARQGRLPAKDRGDDEARWVDLVTRLGQGLGFRVSPEDWSP